MPLTMAPTVATLAVPVGTVVPYAASTVPTGYLLCDGSWTSVATYGALYAVVGNRWAYNGTQFGLPDLRGKFVAGYSTGAEFNPLGVAGGQVGHTHTSPNHSHALSDAGQAAHVMTAGSGEIQRRVASASWTPTLTMSTAIATTFSTAQAVGAALLGTTDAYAGSATSVPSGGTGGGLPPYLTLIYIIKF
jgi:microcystin-dependent protein